MQNLLYVLILLAAFPAGYVLAWMARDEIKPGRKWFIALSIICLIASIVLAFLPFTFKFVSILTLFFIIIICLMAVYKSYDKKWVKNV